MRGPIHPTRIDIPLETRVKVIDELGVTLASYIDLYSQCKSAHWNIKGMSFMPFHQFFDSLSEPLPGITDGLAERIAQLGGTSLGTIRLASVASILPEFPYNAFDAETYIEALANRFAAISKHLRESAKKIRELGDPTTENYYLELAIDNDKQLWFIESFLA